MDVDTASDGVLLNPETDGVNDPVVANSEVHGGTHRQTTYDLGRSRDGIDTIGRTVIDRNLNDTADFLSYGYWLSIDETSATSVVTVGIHAGGPAFGTAPTLPASGTATYTGRAHGLHTVAYAAGEFGRTDDEFRIGEFDADVTLRADFSARTMGGTINNIMSTEEGVSDGTLIERARSSRPYVLTLNDGPVAGDGSFNGTMDVGGAGNISSSGGSWRGRLSSGAGDMAVGAFGARWTHTGGTEGQYVGAFIAKK